MKDWISRLLHHCHRDMLQEGWLSWKIGLLLQTQDLRVGQVNKPYIRLTQENSIKSFIQDCLPYILKTNGLYTTFLAFPNDHVLASRPSHIWHNIILSKSFYHILCVMWFVIPKSCVVTITCDIIPASNPKIKGK